MINSIRENLPVDSLMELRHEAKSGESFSCSLQCPQKSWNIIFQSDGELKYFLKEKKIYNRNRKNLRHFISGRRECNGYVVFESLIWRKEKEKEEKAAKDHWVKWYNKCFCRLALGSLRMFKHFPHDYHGMDCVVALIIVVDFRKKFMAREAHNWLKNSSWKGK